MSTPRRAAGSALAAAQAAREERTLTAALGSGGSGQLLALPMELLVHVLSFLPLTSVLRFSECGRAPDAFAGEDDIWRPLFERRSWANVVPRTVNQHGWRAAYRRTARLESPLILQLSSFRSLVGFARDARPTASSRLIDKAATDAADAAVGDALRSLGLTGACPLRGADVVVVSAEAAEVAAAIAAVEAVRVVEAAEAAQAAAARAPAPYMTAYAAEIAVLCEMGFGTEAAGSALVATSGDIDRAAERLASQPD